MNTNVCLFRYTEDHALLVKFKRFFIDNRWMSGREVNKNLIESYYEETA